MKSTYKEEDVTLLLKDISGLVTPLPTDEREKLIQNGVHYCEMLPLEYQPSENYLEAYKIALENYSQLTAKAVCQVSEKIYQKKGNHVVLVSLARAGVPIGILIKHYLAKKYNIVVPHYSISIIRDKGIDKNALHYILSKHNPETIQFVDGWIGKGAIQKQLSQSLRPYPNISSRLAVLSDPANISELCGTHEDILIPSSCLNSTVSGLISRTFLRKDIISNGDFHGAVYYKELKEQDLSYEFIDSIEKHFDFNTTATSLPVKNSGISEVQNIANHFGISNINFIKPGIGETTRVLLRRMPWKILIKENTENDPVLLHLLRLADEKKIPVEYYPLENYKACGIIKKVSDL